MPGLCDADTMVEAGDQGDEQNEKPKKRKRKRRKRNDDEPKPTTDRQKQTTSSKPATAKEGKGQESPKKGLQIDVIKGDFDDLTVVFNTFNNQRNLRTGEGFRGKGEGNF